MSVERPRTIGRCQELALLPKVLSAAVDGGSGKVLEILGEPGIGKTHLLSELCALAGEQGVPVTSARPAQHQLAVPYGLITDALTVTGPLGHLPVTDQQDLRSRSDDALATILPLLRAASPAPERPTLYHAIRAAIADIATPHGLVIMLDDVHRADSASLDVLSYLLTHPPAAGVLLAIACRPRQLTATFAAALQHAADNDVLDTVELAPLAGADISVLIGPEHGPARQAILHAQSGGNPLYLKALLHLYSAAPNPAGGEPPCGDDLIARLPRDLDTVLRAELELLTCPARLVAESAALLGDHATPEPLAMVAELSMPDVLSALDELTRLDILRPNRGHSFSFRHPLLRAVVHRWAPAGWKIGAHTRAADYLAEPHTRPLAARQGDLATVTALTGATPYADGAAQVPGSGPAAFHRLPDTLRHQCHLLGPLACQPHRPAGDDQPTTADDTAVPAPRSAMGDRPDGTPPPASPDTLSPREREVAHLIARGDTNRQIARTLNIKENTVEAHVGHIFRKLEVRSRASVARIMAVHDSGRALG